MGFMGSGKSETGRMLAARLGFEFVDLDEQIVAAAGTSIPDLFARCGEGGFRDLEAAAFQDVLDRGTAAAGLVVALGGGSPTVPVIRRLLEERCVTIWLKVDPYRAWGRVAGSARPLARTREEFVDLAGRRSPVYEAAADLALDTCGLTPAEVAARLAGLIEGLVRPAGHTSHWRVEVEGAFGRSRIEGGSGCRARVVDRLAQLHQQGRKAAIVTDANVALAWRRQLTAMQEAGAGDNALRVLPPGETTKCADTLLDLWSWLAQLELHRDDVVVVLGGGVVGDVGGFAAATYGRGVELWQVPTSVIAEVDSSVGGKVAINLPEGKNLVGAFYQPALVVVDPIFLLTLPVCELRNGLGEVVKYGLLMGSSSLAVLRQASSELLAANPETWSKVSQRCIRYKAAVVERDERDRGERAVLNLGHTTAHALERVLGYGVIRHGEAVGVGLLVALRISEALLGCPAWVRRETTEILRRFGLPQRVQGVHVDEVLRAMSYDKKVDMSGIRFVGLAEPGKPVVGLEVPGPLLEEAVGEVLD